MAAQVATDVVRAATPDFAGAEEAAVAAMSQRGGVAAPASGEKLSSKITHTHTQHSFVHSSMTCGFVDFTTPVNDGVSDSVVRCPGLRSITLCL